VIAEERPAEQNVAKESVKVSPRSSTKDYAAEQEQQVAGVQYQVAAMRKYMNELAEAKEKE
jgi:hypothetical protein